MHDISSLLTKQAEIAQDKDTILQQTRIKELEKRHSVKTAPLPLQREVASPKPFPFDALGSLLGPVAKRIHEVVKSPDSICGQSILAAASLITQGHADVHIDGRVYPLSLFALTVGESGDRKSAVDTIALHPIRAYEKMLVKTYLEEKKAYKNKLETWKKQRQEVLNKCKIDFLENQLNELEDEPTPPLEPFLLLEEPSYEGLVKLFAIGQPSLGLFSDEGGRMLGGYAMSQDNLLKTACGLSSLWDGKPVTRIRGNDENLILYGRRFSAHLMIQEVVFANIQANEMLVGQGLIARCLIVCPPTNAGQRPYQEVDLSHDPIIERYWSHSSQLLDQPFPLTDPSVRNELSPRSLFLDQKGKARWIQFHDELDRAMGKDGTFRAIRRTASKAAEQALRIAGVLTIFEDVSATCISEENLARALALTRYYLEEAVRISDIGFLDRDLELAQRVLDWMKKKALEENPRKVFSLQEIYQRAGPREVRNKKTAQKVMRILEDHKEICRPNSDTEEWVLNLI